MNRLSNSFFKSAVSAVLLSLPAAAGASGFGDFLRAIDLNQYALGGFHYYSTSYYEGVDDFSGVFPLPTAYDHSILNEYAFYVRDGEFSLRKIFDSDWELAGVLKVQTLGYGSGESVALAGMDRRDWTLQGGGSIGRQFGPLRIDAGAQTDLLGKHGGQEYKLKFAWPMVWDSWYLIPEFEVRYQSDDLINYYFGVEESEATPVRPAYAPGGGVTYSPSLLANWRFHERWYATVTVIYDILPDEIINSPITVAENGWRTIIGVAYDSPAFVSMDRDRVDDWPTVEILAGAFFAQAESKVRLIDSSETEPVDLEDALGLSDSATIGVFNALWRLNNFHRLEIAYFELNRDGTVDLTSPFVLDPGTFPAGAVVTTDFDTQVLKLGYAFSLFHDSQKELSVFGGVHLSEIAFRLSDGSQESKASTSVLMPVIGARFNASLTERISLGVRLDFYDMDFNNTSGRMTDMAFFGEYQFSDKIALGGSYIIYRQDVNSGDSDFFGAYYFDYRGPSVFLIGRF